MAGSEELARFQANPDPYTPAMNGDCVVTFVDAGERVSGKLNLGLDHEDRFYFFASEGQREKFRQNPGRYKRGIEVTSSPLAMQGYDPVYLRDGKQWAKGTPEHQAVYDGRLYQFVGAEQKHAFDEDPQNYVPVLNGDCVVTLVDTQQRKDGSIFYSANHNGRLYLFASQQRKDAFMGDPRRYEQADLALGGNCPVCQAELDKRVPGSEELEVVYRGRRYHFAQEEQRKKFLTRPKNYAVD